MEMRRRLVLSTALGMAALAAFSFAELPQVDPNDPPVDVQGHWIIYSKDVGDADVVEKTVAITQDHHHISGYFRGPNQQGKIHGVVNGRRVVSGMVL